MLVVGVQGLPGYQIISQVIKLKGDMDYNLGFGNTFNLNSFKKWNNDS